MRSPPEPIRSQRCGPAPPLSKHVDAWRRATRRERLLAVFETGPVALPVRREAGSRIARPHPRRLHRARGRAACGRIALGTTARTRAVVVAEPVAGASLEAWVASRFDGTTTVSAVAEALGLPVAIVLETATRLVARGEARRLVGMEIPRKLREAGGNDDPRVTADLLIEASRERGRRRGLGARSRARMPHRSSRPRRRRLGASRRAPHAAAKGDPARPPRFCSKRMRSGAMPKLLALGLRRAAECGLDAATVLPHVETAARLASVLASAGGRVAKPSRFSKPRVSPSPTIFDFIGRRRARRTPPTRGTRRRGARTADGPGERLGALEEAVATGELLADFDIPHRRDHLVRVNVLRVRVAFRRKIEEGRRVLRRGLLVGAAIASGWVAWAAIGERRLSTLGGENAGAADYAAAASPFMLVPAGFEMRAQAAFLRDVERTAREVSIERTRSSEERTAARERRAKESLERARHALAADDFETAIAEYPRGGRARFHAAQNGVLRTRRRRTGSSRSDGARTCRECVRRRRRCRRGPCAPTARVVALIRACPPSVR
jgi:hypothetical protein